MSVEENKALIRRMYELFNKRELDKYDEVFGPGYVEHYPGMDLSLEQVLKGGPAWLAAFPDVVSEIEDMIAEGDKVAYRVTHRGTHRGPYMGIAATGNKIQMTNTCIIRIASGRCAECWATMDNLNLMRQIGAIPSGPPKK